MLDNFNQYTETKRNPRWIEYAIAIIAVLNLALVFFDLTYLSARSLYLQTIPSLVQLYDPVKGIYAHPETQRYLEHVALLEAQLAQTEVRSPEVEFSLSKLRSLSQQIVQDNPFPNAAVLATIQQTLQSRTGAESSFVAFDRFWNQDYLAQKNWQSEIEFWNQQIRPLIDANYYRQVNQFGYPIDYFWLIDLPFIIIFAIDFAVRGRAIQRQSPELNWLEVALRRWYDLSLLIPFWRWLRVIPVTLRLYQIRWLNLKPLQAEAQRDFAVGFAKEVTEVVGIQVIEQIQAAIRRGDVMQWLLYPELRRYVQVNDRNEIEAIITRIADISIYQVLPQIQSDLELLVYYSLNHIFDQFPGYRQLQSVPGISRLPKRTTERLTKNLSQNAYQMLVKIWSDPEITEVKNQLIHNFRSALAIELQKNHNTKELEDLLVDMLEEIKINYVRSITDVEIELIVDKAERIHRNVKA